MGRRIQPCVESGTCNPLSARRRYPSDNIHRINIRTDFEDIPGDTNDGAKNAIALQKATQMTDEAMKLLDDEATLQGAKHFGATMYLVSH